MAMFRQLKIVGGGGVWVVMEPKDVLIEGFNSSFIEFLQVQTG
jgi:hypothetical protein